MRFAFTVCICLMLAAVVVAQDAPVQAQSDPFAAFCSSTFEYIRGDLHSKGKTLVPPAVQSFFDKARGKIAEAVQNPSKIDEYLARGQVFVAKQLQESPLRPSELAQHFDQASEAYKKQVDKLRSKDLDNSLAEKQRSLAQHLKDHPVQPVAMAKNVFNSISQGLKGLHARTLGAIEDTCSLVSDYQLEIRARFEQAKQELASQDQSLASATLESLRCHITSYMGSLERVCSSIKTSEKPLVKSLFRRH